MGEGVRGVRAGFRSVRIGLRRRRPPPIPMTTATGREPNLEALEREWQVASAARAERPVQAQPEGEDGLPAGWRSDNTSGEQTGSTVQSPARMFGESPEVPRERRFGWRALVIASVAVTSDCRVWIPGCGRFTTTARCASRSRAAVPADPLPAASGARRGGVDDRRSRVDPSPRTELTERGRRSRFGWARSRSAENATRAVEELQKAGYRAYSRRVTLASGRPAVGVFLGPYGERGEAEEDRQRAKSIPEYAGGQVVREGPTGSGRPPS